MLVNIGEEMKKNRMMKVRMKVSIRKEFFEKTECGWKESCKRRKMELNVSESESDKDEMMMKGDKNEDEDEYG